MTDTRATARADTPTTAANSVVHSSGFVDATSAESELRGLLDKTFGNPNRRPIGAEFWSNYHAAEADYRALKQRKGWT